MGDFGLFLGTAVASIPVALMGWFRIREYLNFERLHVNWWPQLVRFGAPLVPASLAMYFMTTADRWFVQYYHGEEALGLFAVGAKFSLLLALAVETFRKAWWPIAMDSMHSDDGRETFRMIARLYMGIACAGVVGLTMLSPWLVRWLAAPEFYDAWRIVGILAWQAVFYGFFLIASAGIWKAERTHLNLYLMGGAALFGIGMNWLLVPSFGGMGAAIATVVTYIAWVLISMVVSESLWRVAFSYRLLFVQITSSLAFVFWYLLISPNLEFLTILCVGVVVIIFQLGSAIGLNLLRTLNVIKVNKMLQKFLGPSLKAKG